MAYFETGRIDLRPYDEKLIRLEHDYTDDELLMELRRRGRLARVECENIAPVRLIADGMPIDYQIEIAWRDIAHEAARLHVQGRIPTGAKIENVQGDGTLAPPHEKARRIKFAVNYVVDKR
jgi:hypothetical protein